MSNKLLALKVRRRSLKVEYRTKSGKEIAVERKLNAPFGSECWIWEIKKDILEILHCKTINCEKLELLRFRKDLEGVSGHELVDSFTNELDSTIGELVGVDDRVPNSSRREIIESYKGPLSYLRKYSIKECFPSEQPPFFEKMEEDPGFTMILSRKPGPSNLNGRKHGMEVPANPQKSVFAADENLAAE